MNRRRRYFIVSNQLVLHIDINVIFVSILILTILPSPSGIGILLWRFFCSLQPSGVSPALICRFSSRLLRCRGAATIARIGIWPLLAENPFSSRNPSNSSNNRLITPTSVNCSRNNQMVFSSGTASPRERPKKPHKGQPVPNLKFNLLIRKVVQRLKNRAP